MPWPSVAAAVLIVGGAGAPARAAERPWVEARSPHFQVLCDDGERTARNVALRFEQIRAAFASLGPGLRLAPAQPFTVIAARDEKSLSQILPGYFEKRGGVRPAGLFLSAPQRVFVVVREDVDDESEGEHSVLFHEYVHLLVSLNFLPLPLWLNEGIAEFYAHTKVQSARVLVGRPAPWHLALLRDAKLVPFDEFFAADHDSRYYNEADRASIFYAQSWAMTHWLILGDKGANRPRLQKLIARLEQGASPAEAGRELGTANELRRAMDAYVSQHGYYVRPLPPVDVETSTFVTRPVPPGEIAGWRALVHVALDRKDDARRSVEEALRLAPDSPLGHEASATLLLREARLPEARRSAEEAIRLDPRSMPALMTAGQLALLPGGGGPSEAARFYEAAVQASPEHALGLVALADAKARAGAPVAETLPLARRAAALWPASLTVRLALAEQLLRSGDAAAAQAEAERALVLASTDAEKAAARMAGERIKAGIGKPRRIAVPPAKALADDRLACDQGQMAACISAGVVLETGRGAAVDVPAAAALYEKGCAGGNPHGCHNLGRLYHFGHGVARDRDRARALYDKACATGHGTACVMQAHLLLRNGKDPEADGRAADLYEKACGADAPAGCGALGTMIAVGRGRPLDLPRAYALYKQGCDAGDPSSCDSQGRALAYGHGTEKDLRRAIDLMDKACTADPFYGCVSLGHWLGTPEAGRDHARAARAFERACEAGESTGCARLAASYAEGEGVEQDVAKAEKLALSACGEGEQDACGLLGSMFREKAPAKAVDYFVKACQAGHAYSCTQLAFQYLGGRGVPQSQAKAAAFFTKACDKGDGQACSGLADLAQYGGLGAPDPAKAAALRKKACAAGYQAACGK